VTGPLAIYLNDHLGGATFGRELARRVLAANRGTEFEAFLAQLAKDIEEDREELVRTIDRLGIRRDPVKVRTAWVVEKLGRLKPNGRLVGYSPLSRILELEGLGGGVRAKLSLWHTLADIRDPISEFAGTPFARLIDRAESQLDGLEQATAKAALIAFGGASIEPSRH
jgi:hypothetical protein